MHDQPKYIDLERDAAKIAKAQQEADEIRTLLTAARDSWMNLHRHLSAQPTPRRDEKGKVS